MKKSCSSASRQAVLHRNVLVVDDEFSLREAMCRLLIKCGYKATSAGSAEDAVRSIKARRPDTIFIEVVLSGGIGGLQLYKALRASPSTASIMIILMTGKLPRDVMDAVAVGMSVALYDKRSFLGDIAYLRAELDRNNVSPRNRLVIDQKRESVTLDGSLLPGLPHSCFRLMSALMGSVQPVRREELLPLISSESSNICLVDVTVHRLRRRLKAFPDVRIEATGNGYQLMVR